MPDTPSAPPSAPSTIRPPPPSTAMPDTPPAPPSAPSTNRPPPPSTVMPDTPPAPHPAPVGPATSTKSEAPPPPGTPDIESQARQDLRALITNKKCPASNLLRLAWHDAATYDFEKGDGGPNGSIGRDEELNREENKFLKEAVDHCKKIKEKNLNISNADLYQLAGLVALEESKGPKIAFQLGRKDSAAASPANRLWVAKPGANSKDLRDVFNRMGFGDKEIVALSWMFTLGERPKEESPIQFDNSFFKKLTQDSLLLKASPTCKILVDDAKLHKYVSIYSKSNEDFIKDYTLAHKKLSELGFKYFPNYLRLKKSVLFATTITILVAFLGYFFEVTRA